MDAWYTSRERVMRAGDIKASAYVAAEIDQAIQSATRRVDKLCGRGDNTRPAFAPWTGTLTLDWPTLLNPDAYRFWLRPNSLLSLTTAVSGGETITSNCRLRPEHGPPYSSVLVDAGTASILSVGSGVGVDSLALTGVWGVGQEERTNTAWLLSGSITSSATSITLNAPVGVGDTVRLENERLLVTEKAWADSTQDATLAASRDAETLAVSDGGVFLAGEELLIDAERVLVRDVAGNNLVVRRAVSGSTLAAHAGSSIFWARTCTVRRGTLGTTAAAHNGVQVHVHQPDPIAEQLTVAYALDQRAQETATYARTTGSGDAERQASGRSIKDLEGELVAAYGLTLRYASTR